MWRTCFALEKCFICTKHILFPVGPRIIDKTDGTFPRIGKTKTFKFCVHCGCVSVHKQIRRSLSGITKMILQKYTNDTERPIFLNIGK